MTTIESAIDFVHQIIGNNNMVDPYFLCQLLGITVIDNYSLDKDGYLICSDGLKMIFVSEKVENVHRKKFIVAHEIGHFLMHRNQMYCCSDIGMNQMQRINTPIQEQQANDFASELLLPTTVLHAHLPSTHLSFSVISEIARTYDVSVTMAALKAVKNSNTEDEILLCYEDNKLKWYVSGNKDIRSYQIPSRCPMELDSNANYAGVTGFWDDLYNGPVSQEVFHPFGKQYLVLLAGKEWNYLEAY